MTNPQPGDTITVAANPKTGHLQPHHEGTTMTWLGGDAYAHPDLTALLQPIDTLTPHPQNPRRGDTKAIATSIQINGLYRPAYTQRTTGHVLAGNHTTAAVRELGGVLMPRIAVDVDDRQAVKILLADNRTADLGSYEESMLLSMLQDLAAEQELLGTGYGADDLELLADSLDAAEGDVADDSDRAPTTSEMLQLVDVAWGEPKAKVHHGEVWRLGPHTLVIAKLHTEHHLWRGLLDDDHAFCPYPEPYLTTTELAADRPLLLVQPNPYLAGHLIDKHHSAHPDDAIRMVEQ